MRAFVEIHGTRIRFSGIDAPERSQLCRGEHNLQHVRREGRERA